MKRVLFFLWLLPFFATAQTAHLDDDRVAYRERITVNGVNRQDLYQRAQLAIQSLAPGVISGDAEKGILSSDSRLRLSSTHSLRNRLKFQLAITVKDGSYEYSIDSLYWVTDPRGKKATTVSSKKLVENMEVTGPTAMSTEKQLNEIDMRLQRLIVLLKKAMGEAAR